MMSTRRAPFALVAATCALTLSGCGYLPGRSDTSSTSTPPPAPVVVLDEAGAAEVLPQPPAGWDVTSTEQASPPTWRKTEPAECMDVILAGQESRNLKSHRRAEAEQTSQTGSGDSLRQMSLVVTSYDKAIGPRLLADAQAALSRCATFALYAQDVDDRYSVEPVEVQGAGEQSFAARYVSYDTELKKDVYADRYVVRSGNNLVSVLLYGTTDKKSPEIYRPMVTQTLDAIASRPRG